MPSAHQIEEAELTEVDATPERVADSTAQPLDRPGSRAKGGRWLLATAGFVLLAGLIPLLGRSRYYFYGDTQIGAFGQWYDLGEQLRAGHWPLLDLGAWRAGNYVSEGQWGLFSPLTMGIALAATTVTHVVVFVTVVKLALLMTAGVGSHLLARSYGVPPYAACVAGLAVTVGGTTQYLETPSWVTGEMVWALLPLAWWGMRRTLLQGANPFLGLLFGYLTVTVGYVYGTFYLALAVVACLVDAALARNRVGFVKVFLIGACSGLVAATVYLPGILTASVTTRSGFAVISNGRLQADVEGLLSSMVPTVLSPASPNYPAHYVAWFLPMLAWVDWGRARQLLRPLAGLVIVLVVTVAWVLGPNQVGPIRWPVRVMPVVVLCAVVLTAVLVSRATPRPPSGRRLLVSLLLTAIGSYLVLARFWERGSMTLVATAVVLLGLLVVWVLLRAAAVRTSAPVDRTRAVAVFMAVWTLLVVGVQHAYFPSPPSLDRHMPGTIAGYARPASTAQGDVLVIGNPTQTVTDNPAAVQDFLLASSWFVSPHEVQNVYTTIGFTRYNDTYCMGFSGTTCRSALNKLFEEEPSTGVDRVDLLSVSTLQIFRTGYREKRLANPPDGWRVSQQTEFAVTWVRDDPVPAAGGVVWTSSGLDVTQRTNDARELVVDVGDVPRGGGRMVLSRLDWPGYSVDGARLDAATDGYLVTVDIPEDAAGKTVTVRFDPPGWPLELVCLYVGVGVALAWSALALVRRRRRRTPPTSGHAQESR